MGRGPEYIFFQRWYANGRRVYKKVLNITNPKGNASQNYNEVSPHTYLNGYHQKPRDTHWQGCGEREPLCTVSGNVNWCNHYGGSSKN